MNKYDKYDKFDAYEIHPCLLLDANGNPVLQGDPTGISYEQCQEDDPNIAVWTLYGHIPGQGLESISDHPTQEEAQKAMIALVVAAESKRHRNKMAAKALLIWAILYFGGFGCGYWVSEWANQRSFKEKYLQSLGWAIDQGLLTVNHARVVEMGKLERGEEKE